MCCARTRPSPTSLACSENEGMAQGRLGSAAQSSWSPRNSGVTILGALFLAANLVISHAGRLLDQDDHGVGGTVSFTFTMDAKHAPDRVGRAPT